jgi:hypothetical protein
MKQGFLEPSARFEDLGEQSVSHQLHVGELVLLGDTNRPFQNRDRVAGVAGGDAHPTAGDLHSHERHGRSAGLLRGDAVE